MASRAGADGDNNPFEAIQAIRLNPKGRRVRLSPTAGVYATDSGDNCGSVSLATWIGTDLSFSLLFDIDLSALFGVLEAGGGACPEKETRDHSWVRSLRFERLM